MVNSKQGWVEVGVTDSGFPMIFATALVASLRMSEATTASTGMFVKRFKVGIVFLLLLYSHSKPFGDKVGLLSSVFSLHTPMRVCYNDILLLLSF